MRHVRPHIQRDLATLRRDRPGEVPNHIDQNLPPATLQIEGREACKALMDRRKRLARISLASHQPFAKAHRHVALYEIVAVVGIEARPALANVRPGAKAYRQRRLRHSRVPKRDQRHQRQMTTRGITDDDEPPGIDPFLQQITIGFKGVVLLGGVRMFGRKSIVRSKQSCSQQIRQHFRETMRDRRMERVAAAVKIENGRSGSEASRRRPLALWGARWRGSTCDVVDFVRQGLQTVEIDPRLRNIRHCEGMVELASPEKVADLEIERPVRREGAEHYPSKDRVEGNQNHRRPTARDKSPGALTDRARHRKPP